MKVKSDFIWGKSIIIRIPAALKSNVNETGASLPIKNSEAAVAGGLALVKSNPNGAKDEEAEEEELLDDTSVDDICLCQ